MKPDGVTMDTTDATEPSEAAAAAEAVLQDSVTVQVPSQPEQASNNTASKAAVKTSGKPEAVHAKVKSQKNTKTQVTSKTEGAVSKSPAGTASHRPVNSNSAKTPSAKKTAAAKASAAGAVPKRRVGVAAVSSTVKNPMRVPDKKPVAPARTTSVAAAPTTNGTKPSTVNGNPNRRAAAETRPKSTVTASRPATSTALKPSTAPAAKAEGGAVPKTTRAATGPSASRHTSSTPTPRPTTVTAKPSTTATTRTAASRATTAPSTCRTTAAQPNRTAATSAAAAARKDVSRPPSAAVARRPATAPLSAATKKPEPSKTIATGKPSSASKWSATSKAADPKVSQAKTQQPAKPCPTKRPLTAAARVQTTNKPFGQTPPASPASKATNSSPSQAKLGTKPTQVVSPFTAIKRTKDLNSATSVATRRGTGAAAAATVRTETQAETGVASPQVSPVTVSATEEVSPQALTQITSPAVIPQETAQSQSPAPSLLQMPVREALPETSPLQEQLETSAPLPTMQEPVSAPAETTLPPVASPQELSEEPVYLSTDQTSSISQALPAASDSIPQVVPPTNLNEEEDEEEKEGSQLVSVSEMSGTTQPTEESRPGSAGPVGGSAWRAGGALLSELDSEDVSGSQQGASELSAPGVLEGTESMDDLGDGSLKGAIDMEGASAGSPDFEKVPDIPVNDFEEDDDDDNDRVCDMDVGSERTDEPQRPRHDNDVDDEDDDDVEMASEGVTESGLESYGNADEDDFAEDERLDNLNRVAQPPPPPQLPSAPAAQWDQPNPFADPWAEPLQPLQPQQLLDHISQPLQVAGAAAVSPLLDPWYPDSGNQAQSPAQAWLELSSSFVAQNQEAPSHSSAKNEAQLYMDQAIPSPMQTLAPAPPSAPGMSLSSTLSSESSTPEEAGDYNREGKTQPQGGQVLAPSPQPDADIQNLGVHLERKDEVEEGIAEAETLPSDIILGDGGTVPTSNPSSSSVTEDEASDTEGEAQLDDSLEPPAVSNITFDSQPPAQRCLSTVEEGEEAETGDAEAAVTDEATPPSATSLASYGFDTVTTASNSNAQSTGETCIKSPGIFSLEELPEEAKELGLPQHYTQSCPAEQQYIECGKQEVESIEHGKEEVLGSEEARDSSAALQQSEENPDDIQPPYYSAICEKTENSFAGNV